MINEPSLIRDIFGGILRTEVQPHGYKTISKSQEPFYVINLEIPRDGYDLSACLKSWCADKTIHDYQFQGKKVKATHR